MLAQGVEGGNEIQGAVINVVKQCDSDEGVSVSSVTGQLKSKFSEAQVQYQASTLLWAISRYISAACRLSHALRACCVRSALVTDWLLRSAAIPIHTRLQVREALEWLSGEGHVYSTIDDDHFKSTDS